MDIHYRDIRKIDPTRGSILGDGTPNDNDRIEIGPTQLAFADVIFVEQGSQAGQFVLLEIPGLSKRIDARLMAKLPRHPWPNAVEVLQGVNRLLLRRNVDSEKAWHNRSFQGGAWTSGNLDS